MSTYAELAAMSNFSFLEGGSHGYELILQAHALGLKAVGIADRNTFAGIVRAHSAWSDPDYGNTRGDRFRLVVGVRLVLSPTARRISSPIPSDLAAYSRLCQLLSLGKRRAPKGECHLDFDDLAAHAEGSLLIVMPPGPGAGRFSTRRLRKVRRSWPSGRAWLAAVHLSQGRRPPPAWPRCPEVARESSRTAHRRQRRALSRSRSAVPCRIS
jgi:error-prone DNA polymerase